ncbi:MAG: histidine--tRNA ligase [Bifidobacteriaceae bacterium]|jgi:histidyl-tRNA synthetase|nr:histidine--tRNA ligase [Bifidobacteriaceae bacterium]
MARLRSLSGFPEWLPAGRLVERHVIDKLCQVFRLHGFQEIETRAVEPLDQLLRKGETSQEVYLLRRLQDLEQGGVDSQTIDQRTLGLHFDLTVPLARYVLEHAGNLDFPFKRYQCQKVWRGERPQEGRFREFYQADLDVIGQGDLPFHYEVELPLVMAEALAALNVGEFRVLASNRKLAEGFAKGLGLPDARQTLHWIDKADKIGWAAVQSGLEGAGLTAGQAAAMISLAEITQSDAAQLVTAVKSLAAAVGSGGALMEEGLTELAALLKAANARRLGMLVADLKIARGLDYYTGSVYETVWLGHESIGSVCSGGRYDSLASQGSQTYPGVGLAIGVSRLVSRIVADNLLIPERVSPAVVVVAVVSEAEREKSDAVATGLRARGIAAEVAPYAAKFGKQIKYADQRGVPFVWFPAPAGQDEPDQVKDIRSGLQTAATVDRWTPPPADLTIGLARPGGQLSEQGPGESTEFRDLGASADS